MSRRESAHRIRDAVARIARPAAPLAFLGLLMPCFATPAAATPTTTWDLYQNCTQIIGSGSACVGDGNSHAGNGNEYKFSSITSPTLFLTASAYHSSNDWNWEVRVSSANTPEANMDWASRIFAAPGHAVDNEHGYDFVVFALPSGTNFDKLQIKLSPFGTKEDMNASIFYGTPTLALGIGTHPDTNAFGGLSISNLLADGFSELTTTNLLDKTTIQAIDISSPNVINYIIVAASLTPGRHEEDYFKINAITAIDSPSPVPEPASFALFGAGLLGLRKFRRRKTAA